LSISDKLFPEKRNRKELKLILGEREPLQPGVSKTEKSDRILVLKCAPTHQGTINFAVKRRALDVAVAFLEEQEFAAAGNRVKT
jgi:hypothetical protein